MLAGARPVFVDVDESYNMNLERATDHCTPRTRAIVFVHLYGQMSNPIEIEAFAQRHGLVLIEDAAQAIGASFNGQPAGSIGAASSFSFNSTKTISAPGGGGAVLTDDGAIAERGRRLRCHGRSDEGIHIELAAYSVMPTATAGTVLDSSSITIAPADLSETRLRHRCGTPGRTRRNRRELEPQRRVTRPTRMVEP